MENRTRFLNIMNFKSVDEVPNYEIGIWPQTEERWIKEGMPANALSSIIEENMTTNNEDGFDAEHLFIDKEVSFFNLSHIEFTKINTNIPEPSFGEITIEEDERTIIYRDSCGVTHKALKEGTLNNTRTCMDQYIDFPVKDRASFLELKKRYIKDLKRYPDNWDEMCLKWEKRTDPLCLLYIGEFGYYSMLRRWMGTVEASYVFYDEPLLVEEMFEFLTDYIISLIDKALKDATYDCFHIFEDMAFNSGPLISPEMTKKFILPQYKKLITYLHKHDIRNIMIDCDGNIDKLIPIWIEAGINCIYPLEVNAGSGPVAIRKKYGNEIAMIGGIDKFTLTKSKKEIEYEVESTLDYMLPRGGYIPTLDHLVQPNVSYENFLFYLEQKSKRLKVR